MLYSAVVMFITMVVVGMCFNPMNILAYRFDDLYISLTLFYGGLLMAANMMWSHELVHYMTSGHFNVWMVLVGIALSVGIAIFLLRSQLYVDDRQWLKRMISHHSTALTTSTIIEKRTKDPRIKKLAKEIIDTQEKEIALMKQILV